MDTLPLKFSLTYLRAAAIRFPNFCTHIEDNCKDPGCFKGISGDVWELLAKDLNFTYTVRKASSYGSLSNEGGIETWSGMIGKIFTYFGGFFFERENFVNIGSAVNV